MVSVKKQGLNKRCCGFGAISRLKNRQKSVNFGLFFAVFISDKEF